MKEIVINIILWIWSHLPIVSLSDDENFATLKLEKIKNRSVHFRFSLLNLMLGDRIIYIITYDVKERKPKLMHFLCLENMDGILLTDEKIEGIQDRFREHIKFLQDDELEVEKESLCYHIQTEEQRISTSMDKLNIYATIILTIIPLILAILDLKKIITLSFPLLIGVILLIYALINICFYVFGAIKIQGIKKSTFGDLRSSETKKREILVQYQYDWQQLKYKAQLFVSFVLNLQEWVIAILVLAAFVSVGISFENINSEKQVETVNYNSISTVYLKEIDKPYSKSAVVWSEMISNIEKKECRQVIFILHGDIKNSLVNKLNKYKGLNIKFVEDETLEKGKLKIIQEE